MTTNSSMAPKSRLDLQIGWKTCRISGPIPTREHIFDFLQVQHENNIWVVVSNIFCFHPWGNYPI